MYTIEDLSNKKVALVNDGTLEELREVLGIAFPNDEFLTEGTRKYYFAKRGYLNKWYCSDKKPDRPIQSVKDFIKQIRGKEMKEQEEFKLPDKWCILGDRQEVVDYSNINGAFKPYTMNEKHYHHYPSYQDNGLSCTTSREIEEGYTEITFEQFKKYVLKEEMKDKEQEYELVDFKIEDLKEGETLVHEDSEFKIEGFVGNICFLTFEGVIITYTKESLKNKEFKLKVSKPKLEKIQGFEVRKYPELPLVEVSDDEYFPSFNVSIVQLKEVLEGNSTPFFDGNSVWGFCRPVPLEKRNFIEIEKD